MEYQSIQKDLESLDSLYKTLNVRAEKLYDFVYYYNKYMQEARNYGTGNLISMPEIHILTAVEQEPGVTISQLSKKRSRTLSAISQTVKSLEKSGYIYKEKRKNNNKELLLYPTEQGKALSRTHKLYDIADIGSTTEALLKECTVEDLDTFYRVLEIYLNLLPKE
jgi:DNA-binding MarR family transcriptional regulator